jgi:nicotinamidase-related amidase
MKNCALLIVDLQKAYFNNDQLETQKQKLVGKCNELIGLCRQNNIPVFNIRTEHAHAKATWTLNMIDDRQGYLFAGDAGAANVDNLAVEHAITVIKTRDSAFWDTTLEHQLRTLGITRLILCGVSTHTCIAQTAADAYAANFRVLLAEEAVASHIMDLHEISLDVLEEEYRQRRASNAQIANLISRSRSAAG